MQPDQRFSGIAILIPGYSVEDVPSDLNEQQATELLNAIAFAWHPTLIACADSIPHYRYADISDLMDARQILIVPQCSEDWMGHDWKQQLEASNSVLLHGPVERGEWEVAIAAEFERTHTIGQDLIDDFLAVGLAWFLVTSLSRRMHYFIDPDETRLAAAIRRATDAAFDGKADEARASLQVAMECLLETREQLFPVETCFVDLCLPGSLADTDSLATAVDNSHQLNLMLSPAELMQIRKASRDCAERIDSAVTAGRCCLVSAGQYELRTSLGTLSDAYGDLKAAISMQNAPLIWGRKRFGLLHSLPQLLDLFEYQFALHVALDDGLYPEREYGHFNWQGPGKESIPSASRLPIAIDSATAFLRLPERLAETMQQDANAIVALARLPNLVTSWLDDLRRIHQWCPVIGSFHTLSDITDNLESTTDSAQFSAGEYLSPFLIQSSVLKTEDPVTGPSNLYATRHSLERLATLAGILTILNPAKDAEATIATLESELQELESLRLDPEREPEPEVDTAALGRLQKAIDAEATAMCAQFNARLQSGTHNGLLVMNTLPFARDAMINWPAELSAPQKHHAVTAAFQQESQTILNCRLPPGGFIRITAADADTAQLIPERTSGRPLVEDNCLRNEHFEVVISRTSGGIADVRFHGTRANRVSQQIAFRYEIPQTVPSTGQGESESTYYAHTVCRGLNVVESGPYRGVVESLCTINDVVDGAELLRFRQLTTVERASSRIQIDVVLDTESNWTVVGNPWMTYLACRFAWDNEAASITRGLLGQAAGIRGERFESPDYIEVADMDQRLLIVPHGRPYHRRSGHRMLDSLLLVEGQGVPETGFRFTLDFDQQYPMRTTMEAMQPTMAMSVSNAVSESAWIMGTTAKNVQLARVRAGLSNVTILLQETEGMGGQCQLRFARRPLNACIQSAKGTFRQNLEITDHGVAVKMYPFGVIEVLLTF